MENKLNENPEKQAARRVIVAVDDDPGNLGFLEGALEDLAEVQSVLLSDSTEAKAFLEANHVDVLITDLQMPEVDGLELARIAKGKGVGKVIVMSGAIEGDEEVQTKIVELGIMGLSKPFREDRLREIIGNQKI